MDVGSEIAEASPTVTNSHQKSPTVSSSISSVSAALTRHRVDEAAAASAATAAAAATAATAASAAAHSEAPRFALWKSASETRHGEQVHGRASTSEVVDCDAKPNERRRSSFFQRQLSLFKKYKVNNYYIKNYKKERKGCDKIDCSNSKIKH